MIDSSFDDTFYVNSRRSVAPQRNFYPDRPIEDGPGPGELAEDYFTRVREHEELLAAERATEAEVKAEADAQLVQEARDQLVADVVAEVIRNLNAKTKKAQTDGQT